jgi:hypothetical protein
MQSTPAVIRAMYRAVDRERALGMAAMKPASPTKTVAPASANERLAAAALVLGLFIVTLHQKTRGRRLPPFPAATPRHAHGRDE